MSRSRGRLRRIGAVIATIACGGFLGSAEPVVTQAVPIGPECPALYILGIQGTGQSSDSADPTTDSGAVGALLAPVVAAVPNLVQRSYIAYPAAFGGVVPGVGFEPYVISVAEARHRLDAAASEIVSVCPHTALAVAGYSQGAQAVAEFARAVGAGAGPVTPDHIAGIALYSNPTRGTQDPVFPGRPGQLVPDPAPGTDGAAVSAVEVSTGSVAGAGLDEGHQPYGALTGRVADICVEGDLACAAPADAAVLRAGAAVAAQADLHDPIAALGSLYTVWSNTLGHAWTAVLINDVQFAPGRVDYRPRSSLAQRLIEAADPRNPAPSLEDLAVASERWNTIAAIVAADPLTLLPRLAGELSAAWDQFLTDNRDLTNPAVWARFADTIARHNGYAISGQMASGTAWFVALALDLAGGH